MTRAKVTGFTTALIDLLRTRRAENVSYNGTHVYASVDPDGDAPLRRFLHVMDGFPGYAVCVKERKATDKPIRCNRCKKEIGLCPACNEKLRRTVEKGVDVAIATEMIQMAFDNVYDVGVLCSNDADLRQAIVFIQQRIGKQVYHLHHGGVGMSVRNACWDHLRMDGLLEALGLNT